MVEIFSRLSFRKFMDTGFTLSCLLRFLTGLDCLLSALPKTLHPSGLRVSCSVLQEDSISLVPQGGFLILIS